jgi:hypothetical protein
MFPTGFPFMFPSCSLRFLFMFSSQFPTKVACLLSKYFIRSTFCILEVFYFAGNWMAQNF